MQTPDVQTPRGFVSLDIFFYSTEKRTSRKWQADLSWEPTGQMAGVLVRNGVELSTWSVLPTPDPAPGSGYAVVTGGKWHRVWIVWSLWEAFMEHVGYSHRAGGLCLITGSAVLCGLEIQRNEYTFTHYITISPNILLFEKIDISSRWRLNSMHKWSHVHHPHLHGTLQTCKTDKKSLTLFSFGRDNTSFWTTHSFWESV